jgi:hypothetical protein
MPVAAALHGCQRRGAPLSDHAQFVTTALTTPGQMRLFTLECRKEALIFVNSQLAFTVCSLQQGMP